MEKMNDIAWIHKRNAGYASGYINTSVFNKMDYKHESFYRARSRDIDGFTYISGCEKTIERMVIAAKFVGVDA